MKRCRTVPFDEASRWLEQHPQRIRTKSLPFGYETQRAFARRVGLSFGAISYLSQKKGLPTLPGGTATHIEGGLKWLEQHPYTTRSPRPPAPEGYEGPTRFAKRVGFSTPTIIKLIAMGLPVSPKEKTVHGMRWVDHNYVRLPPGYVKQSTFAKRIGTSFQKVAELPKQGLPTLPGGTAIHLEDGLQ
jgi:hypothetical protein